MKILFIFGTRPEAIKLAPLVQEFRRHATFEVSVCVTGQHREMLDQVLDFFEITPQYDLNLMQPNQTLFSVTARALEKLEPVLDDFGPDWVVVQGDTTTAMVGALAAYYRQVKIVHVEAGLRSHNLYSPWPEEGNRSLVGRLATLHLAPTQKAVDHLAAEGVTQGVHATGNTVIDALFLGLDLIKRRGEAPYQEHFSFLDLNKKLVLVTGHRRESFGEPFENICRALADLAAQYPEVQWVYPVHLNPNVQGVVKEQLGAIGNVHLIAPLSYPYLIWLMNQSDLVLTDSGGIQEEAPSLGKPVLVMREVTERQEGIEAGTAMLVGTDYEVIVRETRRLLDDAAHYEGMAQAVNPYGDGTACRQIVELFLKA